MQFLGGACYFGSLQLVRNEPDEVMGFLSGLTAASKCERSSHQDPGTKALGWLVSNFWRTCVGFNYKFPYLIIPYDLNKP